MDFIDVALHPEQWEAEVEMLRQKGLPARRAMNLVLKEPNGAARTVNDLREDVCRLMHLEDFRLVRLLLWRSSPLGCEPDELKDNVTGLTPCNNLCLYDFQNAFIEVKKRKRGGKKPGNGWYKDKRRANLPLQVVGMLGRVTAFANTNHCYMCVNDAKPWETLLRILEVLQCSSIILCGGRCVAAALQLQLLQCGLKVNEDGLFTLKGFRVALAVEEESKTAETRSSVDFVYSRKADRYELQPFVDSVDRAHSDEENMEDRNGKSKGRGKGGNGHGMGGKGDGMGEKGGKGKGGNANIAGAGVDDDSQRFTEHTVTLPDLHGLKPSLVVVYGRLHQGASLAAVLEHISPCRSRSEELQVLHYATTTQCMLIESDAQRQDLAQVLNGNQLSEQLDLCGVKLPSKCVLTSPSAEMLLSEQLPVICRFKLRVEPLGYVVQLRKNHCCAIDEVSPAAVAAILQA